MDIYKNAARTLQVDSLCAYFKVKKADIHTHPNFKFAGYTDNITKYVLIVPETNYVVQVTWIYGKAYFKFSLPRLVYTDNSQLLTVEQAEAAIKRLAELAGLPTEDFCLTRLDITHDTNFKPTSLPYVQPQLAAPKYHLKEAIAYTDKETGKVNGNFLFHSKPVKKRYKKSTVVYGKGEKTRVETRLFSAATIKTSLGLDDTDLKMGHLFTEAFAELSGQYYTKIVTEMTSKNPEHKLVKGFKKAALKVVPAGLLY